MIPVPLEPPRVLPLIEQRTIIHLEDEEAYEFILRHVLRREDIGYLRVSLLSEAAHYIRNNLVEGFIVDLKLPPEAPEAFENWGNFARDSMGFIAKIRHERPDLPIVVLTNLDHPDLVKFIANESIFRKTQHTDMVLVEALVAQLLPASVTTPPDLEPNLQYLVEAARRGFQPRATSSTWEGEIAVLAKVTNLEAWQCLEGVRSGIAIPQGKEWLVTGRVQVGRVEAVHRQPFVKSLQAGERLRLGEERGLKQYLLNAGFEPPLQAEGEGCGVVVGVIDRGCDFAHPRFRRKDDPTRTRLLALWHQAGPPHGPCRFGALYDGQELNEALRTLNPYSFYHPDKEAHGTHVMDIAAGGPGGEWAPGIAPAADLIFVDLSVADVPWETEEILESSLGNSVNFVEALEFMFRTAGDRPCVVNASVSINSGPHDGSTLVEQAIDALVRAAPNRAVVLSAGNDRHRNLHAQGTVQRNHPVDLRWRVFGSEGLYLKLEVWYSSRDKFSAELITPSGECLCHVLLGGNAADRRGPQLPRFMVTHRSDPNNGDNVIGVFLGPDAKPGEWRLRLHGEEVAEGAFHAWIDTVGDRPASFPSSDPGFTLSSIACGHESFAVGSYDSRREQNRPCSRFSGSGPTRDARQKPDLCAPGEAILAACSCSPDPIAFDGTSMAAPHLTGFIALLLEEARARGCDLSSVEIRQKVLAAVQGNPHPTWTPRSGWGFLPPR